MAKYRGKKPTAIKEIWSGAFNDFYNLQAGRSFWARTNDGVLYWIDPVSANHVLPKLGQDATTLACCIPQDAD